MPGSAWWTGKEKLLFGIVGHSRPAIEDGDRIVGCCLESRSPCGTAIPADATPLERIALTHDRLNEVREHERLSTRRIAQLAGSGHDDGNPLFDVLFNFIDFHVLERLESGIVAGYHGLLYAMENTNTLLDFSISGTFGDHSLSLFYLESLYAEDEAARLAAYFTRILTQFVEAPEQPLDFDAALGEERATLLAFGSGPRLPYPRTAAVAALFDEQVRLHGDRPAIAIAGRTLSYRELQQNANAVAQELRGTYGLGRGACVAIRLPRTEWAIVAMLGILKAGGVYVPLDPESPARRLEHIVRETGARIVLAGGDRPPLGLEGVSELDIVTLAQQPVTGDRCPPDAGGDDLAYIMYTSGSTGVPKGALIEQRAIVRLVRNTNYVTIAPSDRIAQAGSIAFDACTFEIWGALLNGACVTILEAPALVDAERFAATLQAHGTSVLFLTTSLFNQFAEADPAMFAGLRVVLTGGENASPNHFNAVRTAAPALDLLHVYGPTENTTFSTFYRVARAATDAVPIGMPIANSSVYIVDGALRLLPFGVPGEICTGGDGVARGYLNSTAAAAAAFTAAPCLPGGRLYRTGDVGTWLADGSIQFLGRLDGQVKVRGFRVEPGEIEAVMHAHPAIVEAIVIPHRGAVGTIELAAYYTTRGEVTHTDLRGYLASALPAHMVPAYLRRLDVMPLSLTGKIDRRGLPEPDRAARRRCTADATPRDERERLLAEIWCLLLGRERVGIHDDYFALGGDSIKSIQMSSRLRQAGWKLEMRALFEHPSIAALAPTLQPREPESAEEETGEPIPLTPVQHWFFASHAGTLDRFNLSLRLRAGAPIDPARLRGALQAVWEHHDALRLRFGDSGVVALRSPSEAGPVPFEILSADDAGRLQAELDLHAGPLFKSARSSETATRTTCCSWCITSLPTRSHAASSRKILKTPTRDAPCRRRRRPSRRGRVGWHDSLGPRPAPPKRASGTTNSMLRARRRASIARTDRIATASAGRSSSRSAWTRRGSCSAANHHASSFPACSSPHWRVCSKGPATAGARSRSKATDASRSTATSTCRVPSAGLRRSSRSGSSSPVRARANRWNTSMRACAACRAKVPDVRDCPLSCAAPGGPLGPAPPPGSGSTTSASFGAMHRRGSHSSIRRRVRRSIRRSSVPMSSISSAWCLQKALRFSFTYSTEQFDTATIEALGERFRRELWRSVPRPVADAPSDVRPPARPQFPGVSADELAAVLRRFQ